MLDEKKLSKKGERRGTRYHPAGGTAKSSPARKA